LLAIVQQDVLAQNKPWCAPVVNRHEPAPNRVEATKNTLKVGQGDFWKERQLRDYRKANGLCYKCGDKFDPHHQFVQKQGAALHAICVENNTFEISETVLNLLALQDFAETEQLQLSLNAMAGTDGGNTIRLRALAGTQVLVILIDSGSTNSFVNINVVQRCQFTTVPIQVASVKVANGEYMQCNSKVQAMEWWTQGHTFQTDMLVLDIGAYDAIIGVDWLKSLGDITGNWNTKTLVILSSWGNNQNPWYTSTYS
jgi:hypothetical protein